MTSRPSLGGAGRAIAAGTIAATILGFILAFTGLPLAFAFAAIVGGFLTGRTSARSATHGIILGTVVGGLSVVAVVVIGVALVASGLLALPPSTQQPDVTEAALALGQIVLLQVLGGASGGAVGFRFRSRSRAGIRAEQAAAPQTTPTKSCLQCGARIPVDANVCSFCGAKQTPYG